MNLQAASSSERITTDSQSEAITSHPFIHANAQVHPTTHLLHLANCKQDTLQHSPPCPALPVMREVALQCAVQHATKVEQDEKPATPAILLRPGVIDTSRVLASITPRTYVISKLHRELPRPYAPQAVVHRDLLLVAAQQQGSPVHPVEFQRKENTSRVAARIAATAVIGISKLDYTTVVSFGGTSMGGSKSILECGNRCPKTYPKASSSLSFRSTPGWKRYKSW